MSDSPSTPAPDAIPAATAPQAGEPRRRILVVLEDSALGRRTAAIGVAVAARMGCSVSFQIPIPIEHIEAKSTASMTHALAAYQQLCHDRTQPLFELATGLARQARVDSRNVLTIEEEPVSAVLRIAAEQACDIIVVGSQSRGKVSRVLHSSLFDDLVRLSPRPVLVCRDDMLEGLADPGPTGAAG